MQLQPEDTIVAIASPPGPSARGMIRVSGRDAISVIRNLTDAEFDFRVPCRVPTQLSISAFQHTLDVALMVWPTSRSYTGEPMVEVHTIGSAPVLDAVMNDLVLAGARSAHRGEFTMRAFLAGRIDLVQAEAVLGVIDASDQEELQQALGQLGGGLTRKLREVQSTIIALLGDLEAGLDFVEEDIEFVSAEVIQQRLADCSQVLESLQSAAANRLPSGHRPTIVLAGLPNAGKSSLFNQLVKDGTAIVSSAAGTTRDYLRGEFVEGSVIAEIVDTAGQEAQQANVAQIAQDQTAVQVQHGDLVVWCSASDLSESERPEDERRFLSLRQSDVAVVRIGTRADLSSHVPDQAKLSVSTVSAAGLPELRDLLRQKIAGQSASRSELLGSTAVRCGESLADTSQSVRAAAQASSTTAGDEVTAWELREALNHLGLILGETYSDDVLGHIFSNFCIGK